ncbi:diphosphomevalonate decarboxylase [Agrilactobacillus fermenti]|uniref:diphosphomevalonate decarboxylase n=1 Tax=Agrilactobacillus fermenti TaxID=2586909 RepID=UPI001E4D8F45|nr:diphosphomevalonate decarboxylase [Agrilactobacillus fermenti]MCD2255839.1 diphosphomevalonate decarboxylase [Agrilactobacillus fermenti]
MTIARAHTNIALIKYWGKKDPTLIIPYANSLSLTLDQFYTTTEVTFADEAAHQDEFILNGQRLAPKATTRLAAFLELIRQRARVQRYFKVKSENHVPTAAGLASSASGFAALALAASTTAGLQLSSRDLSRLARRGSGSACRSIFGGFVEWHKGYDDQTSYAEPLQADQHVAMDIGMLALIISDQPKQISSRKEMANTVATSPFYDAFIQACEQDMIILKQAITQNDFVTLGQIAESNAMKMHATTMGAQPPFSYFLPETIQAIQAVQRVRREGLDCYYTMDAGPNVKVIGRASELETLQVRLTELLPNTPMVAARPGPGAMLLSDFEFGQE